MSKVLVLGSTGTVGRHVVDGLLAKGEAVKAASRSGQPVGGAEGVVFEYGKPETVEAAFEGVDRAYVLLASGYVDSKGLLLPLIEAAASRGVKVVFQSVLGVDADDSIPYRQVEIALEKSGTPYVILRPNWFADNFHTFWKTGIDHGRIELPAGEGKSSFIDARDIAASAVAALTSSAFDGNAFNLTGPKAHSYSEAAAILSDAIGKPITYRDVDDAPFVNMLIGSGVAADYANFLASIFHPVREGWTAPVAGDVEKLTGNAPLSLESYAADHAAALRG
ncbi:MAG: SDR family oxidoreductase [Altererythrobacter sp.]|nr:SDR family oxidoreductase [Altererythrobacter sp.]